MSLESRVPVPTTRRGLALPLYSALCAMLLWSACGAPPQPDLQQRRGLLQNRVAAWAPGVAQCPVPVDDPERWRVSPLFSGDGSGPDAFMGRGAGRMCVFQWLGDEVEPVDDLLARLPAGLQSARLVLDAPLVVPLGTPGQIEDLADLIRADLHVHALEQIGATNKVATAATVRVAVFDTALPNPSQPGMPGKGRSPHGRDMALLIRELACPDNRPVGQGCAVHVDTHLALNLIPDGNGSWYEDNAAGGFFGEPYRLATMINRAVTDWQTYHRRDHFIINLSIGWEGLWPKDQGVQEVKAALLHARSLGAAIFAAAGNDKDGPFASDGPMRPGAWETEPGGPPGTPYSNQPLVFSVGGVTSPGAPLASTRDNGRPPLAAYSFQVAFDDRFMTASAQTGPSFSSPVLTGTSISAAVATGLAAVAWSNRPRLKAIEIRDLLYWTGRPIGPTADYCFGGQCPDIHELWMCGLLLDLGQVASCSQPGSVDPVWSQGQVHTAYKVSALVTMPSMQSWEPPSCGPNTVMYYAPGGGADPCPDYAHENYQPEPQLEPQPTVPVCTTCQIKKLVNPKGVSGSATAFLLTAPEVPIKLGAHGRPGMTGQWLHARLRLNHTTGQTTYVDLGGPYAPGQAVIVDGLPLDDAASIDTAELTVSVQGYQGEVRVKSEQIPINP